MAHLSEFKLLIIGAHFPEPNSSAAGSRMMQLIKIFLLKKWKISFASAAQTTDFSEDLVKLGIEVYQISPNEIGRASCREREEQSVSAIALKKKMETQG